MDEEVATKTDFDVEAAVRGVLDTIERDREREIVSRRFGLFDRKETLEQIGELLGITRERVRQLEKAIVTRLKASAADGLPHIKQAESAISRELNAMGKVARITDITPRLAPAGNKVDQSRVAFLATLSPKIEVIDDSDHFWQAVALAAEHSEKAVRQKVDKLIEAIEAIGQPTGIEAIAEKVGNQDHSHVKALAGISKRLANLHDRWGLIKWPMVNPKNIRDKIYVILHESKQPMHFSEIAKAISASDFKRKDVTTQAIHNELIKDGRFVLIGRGIYALKEWGYKKGTVADVIAEILQKEGGALHRDEIVRRVLKSRQVKETTILLNLQGKPQFKRVAKATYALSSG
ncbi:hypothetical protein HY380_01210 [Candidatus Saccharibacteria bacterium]|nr:hypothetical protein [Candidatus Saccharibacteria bacterium]